MPRARPGRDTDDLIVIFVGHVVDAAIVLNRTIHRGPGSAAGGIDHLLVTPESAVACGCGRVGCLQAVACEGDWEGLPTRRELAVLTEGRDPVLR